MHRNFVSAIALAGTAAVLAMIPSSPARADDITVDRTPFVSSRTRAEVQAELLGQAAQVRAGSGEWAMQFNDSPRIKSGYTSAEAKAEFKSSRDYLNALYGEDSGSAYFLKAPGTFGANPGAVMGGPAR